MDVTQSFASHSHNSSVRCVAHSEHYLASGGADDRIVIYDLKSRKEHCMLTHHNSTVNCLQFTDGHTHLISGGSDGTLAITRVGNWQLEKVWEKAHKGASIIDIAIHPTNKLALTLGADNTLRTWNLVKGRQAYVINLNSKSKDPRSLQYIKWAPDGVKFVLCGGLHTDIWSIETGGILRAIEHKNRVSCSLFYDNDTLVVGFENGTLALINLNDKSTKEIEAHGARLKYIDTCKGYLVTCASNGEVKLWNKNIEEIATCNTGCRNTCMNLVLLTWIKKEEKEENDTEELVVTDDKELDKNASKKPRKEKLGGPTVVIESETPKKRKRKSKTMQEFDETPLRNDEKNFEGKVSSKCDKKAMEFIEESTAEEVTPKRKKKKSKEKL